MLALNVVFKLNMKHVTTHALLHEIEALGDVSADPLTQVEFVTWFCQAFLLKQENLPVHS